ncbi:histidine kinase dimerization/phospho-acceptor domain-containing protein [Rubrivirga sp. IMCC43871]|uniref:histidine kinase dimerization/phospho-acceptor domain-containing protein n=1 Tax=Rubrivirga sp. IMCC43871 TaxID=3391575 RepID=UPI00398FA370
MGPILLVATDPDAWLATLPADTVVTMADSAQSARAYLAGTSFSAVFVGPEVAGAEAITALRDVLGLSTPVESVSGPEELAQRLTSGGGGAEALAEVRDELGRIAHSLNNPLAVIAGNAQLAKEVAGSVPTDEMIVDAIASITDAAAELEALFAEVAALRAVVDRAMHGG